MKTRNVVILSITAIICTGMITGAIIMSAIAKSGSGSAQTDAGSGVVVQSQPPGYGEWMGSGPRIDNPSMSSIGEPSNVMQAKATQHISSYPNLPPPNNGQ